MGAPVNVIVLWFMLCLAYTESRTSWKLANAIPFPLKPAPESDIDLSGRDSSTFSIQEHIPSYIRKTYTPKKKNLKPRKLLKILGSHYDKTWMSIERPSVLEELPTQQASTANLKRELEYLDINLTTSSGSQLHVDDAVYEAIENWLLHKSTCPVRFVWEDLGSLFWPRWIKKGNCVANRPCSWPPGMHCVPAENRVIFILRWQCRHRRKYFKRNNRKMDNRSRRNSEKKGGQANDDTPEQTKVSKKDKKRRRKRTMKMFRCRWIRIPFPVLDQCFCSC